MPARQTGFESLARSRTAAVVAMVLIMIGLLALRWRVRGALVAGLVASVVAATYGTLVVRHGLAARFSRSELRRMLSYGLPLVPDILPAWALALIDRIILSRLGTFSDVGQYAIANRIASLLLIGVNAFTFALLPFLLSTFSESPEQEKAARGRTLTYLTFILCAGGLVLTLFAKELIDLVAPKFDDAYKTVGPLVLGAIGYGLVSLLTAGFSIVRKTGRLATMAVLAAVVNIGLN